ncbi:hypothetical protein KI387_025671, partial [Taxus chinensis]
MGSLEPLQRPHVVAFPFPAQGHINPMMEFSKRLVSKNLRVTFVITEANRERMIQAGALRFHDHIRIETISDGIPLDFDRSKGADTFVDLLRKVGAQTFEKLIQRLNAEGDSSVSCIVYDSFLEWVPEIATKFKIPSAYFWTQSCAVYSIYYHYHKGFETEKPSNVNIEGLPELCPRDLPSFLHPSNTYKSILRTVLDHFNTISHPTWILGNSFHELETAEIRSMASLVPIVTVGPLVPSAFLDGNNPEDTDVGAHMWKTVDCIEWLNTMGNSGVVYISFGSDIVPSKEQIHEIAFGLKASGHSFLWVIRPGHNKEENVRLQNFPEGFLEETAERGLVVPWCPQMAVLSHPSVGVFMTHCGWNSTLESLSSGVPVLAVPQWADQTTNAKYIEDEWKTGIRLKRREDGVVAREEVKNSIKEIMESEVGIELRKNALQWKTLAKQAMGQ